MCIPTYHHVSILTNGYVTELAKTQVCFIDMKSDLTQDSYLKCVLKYFRSNLAYQQGDLQCKSKTSKKPIKHHFQVGLKIGFIFRANPCMGA